MTSRRTIRVGPARRGVGRVVPIARGLLTLGALLVLGATPVAGQLRPLDPIDWRDFSSRHGTASLGFSAFSGHPASLTGTDGRLLELGVFDVSARLGRVVVQASGTTYRIFHERSALHDPAPFVEPATNGRRYDLGDFELSTSIRFRQGAPVLDGALRFGVRLPTTDDRVGLERDQTDFFVALSGRYQRNAMGFQLGGGLGVHGVAGERFDQTDPWLYMASIDREIGGWLPSVVLVGQYDTREHGPPRGNEHLAEVRFGLRSLGTGWIKATVYRGIATFSPDLGFELRVGWGF